jgi:hypothetical protein
VGVVGKVGMGGLEDGAARGADSAGGHAGRDAERTHPSVVQTMPTSMQMTTSIADVGPAPPTDDDRVNRRSTCVGAALGAAVATNI